MDITPRGDWIVGKPIKAPESVTGLIMTDSMKLALENRTIMEVLEVGPDVNKPAHHAEAYKPAGPTIQPGDHLVYDKDSVRRIAGKDAETRIMVVVQAVIGHVRADEDGKPEDVAARKKMIEGAIGERAAAERGSQLVVPPGAAPRKPMRLVESAGR